MDESALKTSTKQRIIIAVIAALLLISTVLTYIFIVLNNEPQAKTSSSSDSIEELSAEYDDTVAKMNEAAKPLSDQYFPVLSKYRSEVKAYNEQTAINAVLETKDLQEGTGKTLEEGDTDYLAYYIGWCADGTIFDTSFDTTNLDADADFRDATSLTAPIDPSTGLIEGWEQGVVGMKLGGVRQITMNGDLAYGENQEICGGYNKPLRFIVLPIETNSEILEYVAKLNSLMMQMYTLYYGSSSGTYY